MSHPRTSSTHRSDSKRNLPPYSCSPLENCRRDSLLRSAFVKVTEAFPAVPEPKSSWYETRSGDFTPYDKTVKMIRAAILAAHASGDRQLLGTTLENARAFCRELEADFVSLVPSGSEESLLAVALEETKHQGPADEAAMALVSNTCPTEAERAIGPLNKHYLRLGALLEKCRLHARKARTSSLVVVR